MRSGGDHRAHAVAIHIGDSDDMWKRRTCSGSKAPHFAVLDLENHSFHQLNFDFSFALP